MRFLIGIAFLGQIICLPAKAQWLQKPLSASYLQVFSLSGKVNDVIAARANPAAHGRLAGTQLGVFGEKRFLLKDLNNVQASAGFQTNSGNFGLHTQYFGNALQNQIGATISYGRKITKSFHLGGSIHYHSLNQSNGYGNTALITGSFGMMLQLPSNVQVGVSAFNPTRSKWSKQSEERMPALYSLGIGKDFGKKVFAGANVLLEEAAPIDVQMALHYQFYKSFFARLGVGTQTGSWYGAFGYNNSRYRIDLAVHSHPQLGITPGLAFFTQLMKQNDADEGK